MDPRNENRSLAMERHGRQLPRAMTVVHTAFERQASRTPTATALVFDRKKFTYKQINEDANQLANYLVRKGVRPGAIVGVSVERSPDLTIALLAVLKAGAAYVPLDHTYPKDRLA